MRPMPMKLLTYAKPMRDHSETVLRVGLGVIAFVLRYVCLIPETFTRTHQGKSYYSSGAVLGTYTVCMVVLLAFCAPVRPGPDEGPTVPFQGRHAHLACLVFLLLGVRKLAAIKRREPGQQRISDWYSGQPRLLSRLLPWRSPVPEAVVKRCLEPLFLVWLGWLFSRLRMDGVLSGVVMFSGGALALKENLLPWLQRRTLLELMQVAPNPEWFKSLFVQRTEAAAVGTPQE